MISRSHAFARRLRALRADRALRDQDGVLVAEGIHLAQEALAARATIELAVIARRLNDTEEGRMLAAKLRASGCPLEETGDATIDALQDARAPQPVLLVVRRRKVLLDDLAPGPSGPMLLLIACGVQDPGNLGALVRTAEASGATGLVATDGSADLFHPRAVRASAGSLLRLPVAEATASAAATRVTAGGGRLVGATPRGGKPYDAFDWRGPLALAVGGEGAGLPEAIERKLTDRVAVPMQGPVESLSVGAAAAVLLFEAAKARVSRAG